MPWAARRPTPLRGDAPLLHRTAAPAAPLSHSRPPDSLAGRPAPATA